MDSDRGSIVGFVTSRAGVEGRNQPFSICPAVLLADAPPRAREHSQHFTSNPADPSPAVTSAAAFGSLPLPAPFAGERCRGLPAALTNFSEGPSP
jgi:hypothetical protein